MYGKKTVPLIPKILYRTRDNEENTRRNRPSQAQVENDW